MKETAQDIMNQLCIPFIIDEIERNTVRREEKVLLKI